MNRLSSKIFKNEFVSTFKGDDSGDLLPRQTPGVLYSKAAPTPVSKSPTLLAWSEDLAKDLEMQEPDSIDINVLAGNLVAPSMYPYAACYAGHQFGNWAGQLGDGRAITLGEWQTSLGESWELQLKGAGRTAYSRRGDGRAVLRSSVREYLMSEAMFYLNVPTTRALSLVATGEQVMRDMFYDGHPQYEPGAIVMRAAPSFLRFGNFEMLAARKETSNLRDLVEWTISKFYPHITGENKIILWFREVVERTASLIVEWLRVGFVHGVMNTDNMSILGLTIDYGPFSFLDDFDLTFTPNTTDLPGRRYAYGQQALIGYWNLGCLANAILPLVENSAQLVAEVEAYEDIFWMRYYRMIGNKLGLDELNPDDTNLITLLEQTLSTIKPDMTIFYQLLPEAAVDMQDEQDILKHFERSLYKPLEHEESKLLCNFIKAFQDRVKMSKYSREQSIELMRKSNPRFILRNYLLHNAIEDLEKGDNSLFLKLKQAIKDPYSRKFDEFFKKRPDWANEKAGCSMLSCSS